MYNFLKALMGGVMIGIGCIVYLSVENTVIGSILFSLGLLSILYFNLNLYTGKVGYIFKSKKVFQLLIIGLGNLVGTFLLSVLIHMTRLSITERAIKVATIKSEDKLLSLFILGAFCGILMFIAVDAFANAKNIIIPMLCVSVFILCGFEHSVADSFYFFISGMKAQNYILPLIIIFLGNAAGSIMYYAILNSEILDNLIKKKVNTTNNDALRNS